MHHQKCTADHICNHTLRCSPYATDWERQAAGHFHNTSLQSARLRMEKSTSGLRDSYMI